MSALANLDRPPINSSGAPYLIEKRVKLVSSTNNTLATLETAINAWIAAQEAVTNTFFGEPAFLGSAGTGANLRYYAMIPYAYFVPPP